MYKRIIMGIAFALSINLIVDVAHATDDLNTRADSSRAVVKQFFGALKSELIAGIKAGGPVHAISVCNEQAPEIADQVSVENGWKVARTSLRTRNPINEPDNWERSVLESFETRKAAGEDPADMEHFSFAEVDGERVFRYMKAIPTAKKPCLACHGENVSPEVDAILAELYPEDTAQNYKPGDIRGAFTITQPMD